jgi:hypothetical protein
MKVFIIAQVPDDLAKPLLQHVRDFDAKHADCHFEFCMDGPEIPLADMVEQLRIGPELTFTKIFERGADPRWRGMPLDALSDAELETAINSTMALTKHMHDNNPLPKLLRELSRRERAK